MKIFYTLILAAAVSGATSNAQTGKLDQSFGNSGIVVTPLSNGNDVAKGLAIQDDNKIIVVGTGYLSDRNFSDAFLIRYRSDGTIDSSFGLNGLVIPKLGGRTGTLSSVVIQPDSKILAGGTSNNPSGGYNFKLIRLNSDGSADPTFGASGKVSTDFGADDWLSEIKLLSDGKILAVGRSGFLYYNTTVIARYNRDGSPDYSFGGDGRIVLGENSGEGTSIDVLPNGNYIVGGTYSGYSFSNHGFLKSIKPSGVLDSSFGSNGTTVLPELYGIANVLALPNGKIVCGGSKNFDDSYYKHKFALYRFNANGQFDHSFGTNGTIVTVLDSVNNLDRGGQIVLTPNGQIVQAGSSAGRAALLRYQYNGTLNGFVTTDAGGDSSYISTMAFEKDYSKLVAAGSRLTGEIDTGDDVLILRYYARHNQVQPPAYSSSKKMEEQKQLLIYPNPAKTRLYVEGLEGKYSAKFSLSDRAGNVVYSERSRNTDRKELNVAALKPGIYFLQVEENGQIYKFTIIKE